MVHHHQSFTANTCAALLKCVQRFHNASTNRVFIWNHAVTAKSAIDHFKNAFNAWQFNQFHANAKMRKRCDMAKCSLGSKKSHPRHNGNINGRCNNRGKFFGVTHVQPLSNNPTANTFDERILGKFQLNPLKKQSLNLSSSGDQHNREPIEDRGYSPARAFLAWFLPVHR